MPISRLQAEAVRAVCSAAITEMEAVGETLARLGKTEVNPKVRSSSLLPGSI
jgi:hypothetical protein